VRSDVAGTNGTETFPDGAPVTEPFFQELTHARAHPLWGFSNHASSWRASVWREIPFDEQIDYAEDREWAMRVLEAGWTIVFDPVLFVDLSHSWRGGARNFFTRQRRARRAIAGFAELPPYGAREVLHDWWWELPNDRHSAWFHRYVNYRRWAGLAGRYVGWRQSRRHSRAIDG
jgi:hypothetical protein